MSDGSTGGNVGKVVQVIGPTIDAEFDPEHLPEIYNALNFAEIRLANLWDRR